MDIPCWQQLANEANPLGRVFWALEHRVILRQKNETGRELFLNQKQGDFFVLRLVPGDWRGADALDFLRNLPDTDKKPAWV